MTAGRYILISAALLTVNLPLPGSLSGSGIPDEAAAGPAGIVFDEPGIVWEGTDPSLTFERLAALCGPILWFSPDEPLLHRKKGPDIMIPQPLPFDPPSDGPVVYYRLRTVYVKPGKPDGAVEENPDSRNDSILRLDVIDGIDLDYFFYYESETGHGAHTHDVESVEFKVNVIQSEVEGTNRYSLKVERVVARAHALYWYNNILDVDEMTEFPLTILVEEGKHASCTDKSGDGTYTPGFDVNTRVNDAWGLRDAISSGRLYTGGYEGWMTKVRRGDTVVIPPLPEDSPLREGFAGTGEGRSTAPVYSLRPYPDFPPEDSDPALKKYMGLYDILSWPEEEPDTAMHKFSRSIDWEEIARSISIAYRYDGDSGFSLGLPLLLLKNVEEPLTGGWLTWRFYFKDTNLRDFGQTLQYTPSASRWMDGYFSLGYEVDREYPDGGRKTETNFVAETGVRFRFNLEFTPLKFLKHLGTSFWGVRIGLKYTGFSDVDKLGYVLEIGAGSF